jgi:hypothetical protein
MYYVENIDRETYIKVLNFLGKACNSFSLVEPIADSIGFPKDLPEIKQNLTAYLREAKRVTSWAGTKIKVRGEREKAIEHVYRCCKNSVNMLTVYDSFFDIDDQIDIAFFKDDKCALFTTSHEMILMIDKNFWGDFFDNTDCRLRKAENFKLII